VRWLALVVPLLGLLELFGWFFWRERAPAAEEWAKSAELVDRLRQRGDLLVVAPEWLEPLARSALGDERLPLADLARADESNYRFALELSALGARAPELAGWRELSREVNGSFVVRRLAQPRPEPALYRAIEQLRPETLTVVTEFFGVEAACEFDPRAAVSAGGLGGHLAFPRERFRCAGDESVFVGASVIDDARYRPRRCVAARPPPGGVLRLSFRDVPFGARLVGYAGSSFLLARSSESSVEISVSVGGEPLGRHRARDHQGFHRFEFSTVRFRGTRRELELELRSDSRRQGDFCFLVETR
jgi:hypothetical protein